jgi:DNA-binding protein HU-beta
MTKEDIVNKIAKDAKISKKAAGMALNSFTDSVKMTLKKGGRLSLVGFGTFLARKTKARIGRNPQTGKSLKIPARRRPIFRAGKALKHAVK